MAFRQYGVLLTPKFFPTILQNLFNHSEGIVRILGPIISFPNGVKFGRVEFRERSKYLGSVNYHPLPPLVVTMTPELCTAAWT